MQASAARSLAYRASQPLLTSRAVVRYHIVSGPRNRHNPASRLFKPMQKLPCKVELDTATTHAEGPLSTAVVRYHIVGGPLNRHNPSSRLFKPMQKLPCKVELDTATTHAEGSLSAAAADTPKRAANRHLKPVLARDPHFAERGNASAGTDEATAVLADDTDRIKDALRLFEHRATEGTASIHDAMNCLQSVLPVQEWPEVPSKLDAVVKKLKPGVKIAKWLKDEKGGRQYMGSFIKHPTFCALLANLLKIERRTVLLWDMLIIHRDELHSATGLSRATISSWKARAVASLFAQDLQRGDMDAAIDNFGQAIKKKKRGFLSRDEIYPAACHLLDHLLKGSVLPYTTSSQFNTLISTTHDWSPYPFLETALLQAYHPTRPDTNEAIRILESNREICRKLRASDNQWIQWHFRKIIRGAFEALNFLGRPQAASDFMSLSERKYINKRVVREQQRSEATG